MRPVNRLTQTRYGWMFYNANDEFIGKNLEAYGEWSQSELDFLQSYIPVGGVCIDIGANIGTHTLFFANAVGPEGKVISIEPQRLIFQLLCANLCENNIHHVIPYHSGAAETVGFVKMPYKDYTVPGNFGQTRVEFDSDLADIYLSDEVVHLFPIDSLELEKVDLIKIDVEGVEHKVLKGCVQTLKRTLPLIYSEFHVPELVPLIKSFGYDVYEHPAPAFNPRNWKKNPISIHRGRVENSLFAVPKSKQITIDLKKL